MTPSKHTTITGWREWLTLPDLNIDAIEAKVDTGTQTSVLHVSFIEPFRKDGSPWIRFGIHPQPDHTDIRIVNFAPVSGSRLVKDFEGHEENCFVIKTPVVIGNLQKMIELTLTRQDSMKFRMILGRSALQELNLMIDPSACHLLGEVRQEPVEQLNSI